MGCKAFTPHLVGLAKELEGQAFHFVSSYNQRGDARVAAHELFQNGLGLFAPNVTAALHTAHPGVTGTGYVPYYMVFDHHGDLVHHHQGGPYHGGDGTEVLDRVRKMLKDVPHVYMGRAPFESHTALAKKFERPSSLAEGIAELAAALEKAPEDKELMRLAKGLERHRDRELAKLNRALATDAPQAKRTAASLLSTLGETPWAAPVAKIHEELHDEERYVKHLQGSKVLNGLFERFDELKTIRGNSGRVRNPLDPGFLEKNAKALRALRGDLDAFIKEHRQLPCASGKFQVENNDKARGKHTSPSFSLPLT